MISNSFSVYIYVHLSACIRMFCVFLSLAKLSIALLAYVYPCFVYVYLLAYLSIALLAYVYPCISKAKAQCAFTCVYVNVCLCVSASVCMYVCVCS